MVPCGWLDEVIDGAFLNGRETIGGLDDDSPPRPQKTALTMERVIAAAVKMPTTTTLAAMHPNSRLLNGSTLFNLLTGSKGSYSEVVIREKARRADRADTTDNAKGLRPQNCNSRDLPEDILYAIISPIFGDYVLRAFDGSYPRLSKHETMRPFVEEMAEALMFTGIFSLLHVSRKLRSLTGRLLTRAVPIPDTVGPDNDIYIEAISSLECSVLLCICISRNNTLEEILESSFYQELICRTPGLNLIESPLVQTYGFINRIRVFLETTCNINIREDLPGCPVQGLSVDGYTLDSSLPSYYREALQLTYIMHRETLIIISFVDLLKFWDECFERGVADYEGGALSMDEGINGFMERLKERQDASQAFADRLGIPRVAQRDFVQATLSRRLEITFKMQVLLLRELVPATVPDVSTCWMMQLALKLCTEFNCEYRAIDWSSVLPRDTNFASLTAV